MTTGFLLGIAIFQTDLLYPWPYRFQLILTMRWVTIDFSLLHCSTASAAYVATTVSSPRPIHFDNATAFRILHKFPLPRVPTLL